MKNPLHDDGGAPPRLTDNLAVPHGVLPPEATQRAPLVADGRNIAPSLGLLRGEAAQQKNLKARSQRISMAELGSSTSDGKSYYGLPLLQPVIWKHSIPFYFYIGGLSGASCALGAAAQLGGPGLHRLVKRARLIGTVGAAISAGLLIEDLGRPERFFNMMRVFRPSSPMNMGTWILTAFGGAVGAAALFGQRPGAVGKLGEAAGVAAGVLGLPLAGYTAVLIANTAVPVWQLARASLPPLFLGSAASSAASFFELLPLTRREEKVVKRFGAAGKIAELVATLAIDRDVGRVPRAALPLRSGFSGALWHAAKVATAASLALTVWPGRSTKRRRIAGVLGTLGALATRLSLLQAGRRSAQDAQASFAQQRAGLGAAQVCGG